MRYFLVIFAVIVVAVIAIAGKRGSFSSRPPIEVFPDMDRQLKLRPQQPNGFFANGLSSQLPVEGTIARTKPIQTIAGPVFPFEDAPVNTGRITGTTNFVETNPLAVTATLLHRGQERFTIYCAPCHGAQADGNGVTKKLGMAVVANLHDKRIVGMPDGEIFNTVTHGKNLMQSYAAQVPVEDRWAIIAYVRALQLSRLGAVEDLPAELRDKLPK
ncbi:MAG TPA: cytochrome c [Verrucomicrobiae bacterium]